MNTAVTLLTVLAVAAVAVILGMGIWNMLKGGDGNTSQKLMRARVIAQAIAIVLLMGALFFFGRGAPPG
jgi:hypothetical protein